MADIADKACRVQGLLVNRTRDHRFDSAFEGQRCCRFDPLHGGAPAGGAYLARRGVIGLEVGQVEDLDRVRLASDVFDSVDRANGDVGANELHRLLEGPGHTDDHGHASRMEVLLGERAYQDLWPNPGGVTHGHRNARQLLHRA